ncbi:hypothetical protein HFN89_02605 [Rhizobium laguerreae]|nr:hypothetical protein [Rhizobium laguerreae]
MSGMHQHASMTSEQAKSAAKNIKSRLEALGVEMSIGHAYEALAGSKGYANWSTMKANLETTSAKSATAVPPAADATEDLKEKLREAVRFASTNRGNRPLFVEIRHALYRTLNEATADLDAIQTLTGPFSKFLDRNGSVAGGSFVEVFRGYLGKQLIPQIADTIAEVLAGETKGNLAQTLIAVELLLGKRFLHFGRERTLLVEDLSFEKFIACCDYIMSNERLTLIEATRAGYVVRFANGEIDPTKAAQMISSIEHLIRHGPRLAFEMFLSERSEIIGREMGVIHRIHAA